MIRLVASAILTAVCTADFMGNRKAQLQRGAEEKENEKMSAVETVSVRLDFINRIFG